MVRKPKPSARTQESLDRAEADRREQERKTAAERHLKTTLERLIEENNLAGYLAQALGIHHT